MKISVFALFGLLSKHVAAEVYLKEQFNDDTWKDRWIEPTKWKPSNEMGTFERTAGEWYGDSSDTGIKTTPDARFFGLSAPMTSTLNNSDKDLVLQYSVKHEQGIDCGGAYIKLLSGKDLDPDSFGGDTPYSIMFGPDICGSTKRTHVIVNYEPKGENVLISKDIPCEKDELSHLYTLVIRTDNTFEVLVDNKSVRSGNLEDEFDLLPPKEIQDPDLSKPKDWVDEREIPDPSHVKPDGYDDISPEIPDPEAVKPDDWDDEDDGEWEPPMIDNPDWDGPWKQKKALNPDYKGEWTHPMVPNPEYKADPNLFAVCKEGCTHVGFELWQVKSGSIFDDIIVTDSLEEAQKFAEETFFKKKDGEKEMYDEKERKEREAREAMNDDEDDDDDDDSMDMDDMMGDEF